MRDVLERCTKKLKLLSCTVLLAAVRYTARCASKTFVEIEHADQLRERSIKRGVSGRARSIDNARRPHGGRRRDARPGRVGRFDRNRLAVRTDARQARGATGPSLERTWRTQPPPNGDPDIVPGGDFGVTSCPWNFLLRRPSIASLPPPDCGGEPGRHI